MIELELCRIAVEGQYGQRIVREQQGSTSRERVNVEIGLEKVWDTVEELGSTFVGVD